MSLTLLEKSLLFCLFVFLPSQLGYHLWPSWSFIDGIRVDYLSPTIYTTDIIIISLVLIQVIRLRSLPLPKSSKYSFLLFLLLILNLIHSLNPWITGLKLLKLLELVWLGYYISTHSKSIKNLFSLGLSLALIWISLLAIWQFSSQSSIGGMWYWLGERTFSSNSPGIALGIYPPGKHNLLLRPYSSFSHPNSLAGFILITLLLISNIASVPSIVAKILGLIALYLSLSRTALLAFFLISGLILFNKHKKTLAILVLVTTLPLGTYFTISTLSSNSQSFDDRLYLTRQALNLILTHPFLGIGLGNYVASTVNQIKSSPQVQFQPVHNFILLLASELGIPLCVSFLILLFRLMERLRTQRQVLEKYTLFSILITGFTDHYWLTLQQNMLLLAIVLGFISRRTRKRVE